MTIAATNYRARSAREAAEFGYGTESYWTYLEESTAETAAYFAKRGDTESAERMFTRSLSEALEGNDGP